MNSGYDPMDMNLVTALTFEDSSARLQAALTIGASPEPDLVDAVVARCAIEPDFYVRDMLTWALTRFPNEITVPKLLAELHSENAQARSQSLHTLSKIKEVSTWPAITRSLLRDSNDEVARSAWRAAVILVPDEQKKDLAEELATQLGRGDREVQLSLSRALITLGEEIVEPVLKKAMGSGNQPNVHAHAAATERLLRNPNASFELAIHEAKRIFALGKER